MFSVLGRPGSDLLFQALRLSIIGAGEFNGRVRDGIGFRPPASATRSAKNGKRTCGAGRHSSRGKAVPPAHKSMKQAVGLSFCEDVDGRDKPGHDGLTTRVSARSA